MSDHVSMREAASTLGVSQLRVRELIRKGTLAADKVIDAAGERWSIAVTSMQEYVQRRGQSGVAQDVPALIESLERRLRVLASELGSTQELLAHLKAAAVKQAKPAPETTSEAEMEAVAAATEAASELPPEPEPKPKPKKPVAKPKPKANSDGSLAEGGTLAEALKSAGVEADKPKRKTAARKTATTPTAAKKKSQSSANKA